MSSASYEKRPAKIELPSIKYCLILRDMIMVSKILNGYELS